MTLDEIKQQQVNTAAIKAILERQRDYLEDEFEDYMDQTAKLLLEMDDRILEHEFEMDYLSMARSIEEERIEKGQYADSILNLCLTGK